MIRAFIYLQLTSLRNALTQRLRRLKQPKYLFGAIFGAVYFYLFFFRHLFHSTGRAGKNLPTVSVPAFEPYVEPLGALVLLSVLVLAWILPSARAALQFTEAEVAFLFPAPVTRRSLIHFKLLKSQLAILFSALLFGLLSNRVAWLGGGAVLHALGWWVILSTINLHLLGASFARERLLQRGVTARRRRVIGFSAIALGGAGLWLWLRHTLPPFPSASLLTSYADASAWRAWADHVLASPPVAVLLFVPQLVLKPFFAANAGAFALAIGPALALIAAHYWWVVRADVSFEDASVKQARTLAETVAAVRAGNWRAARNVPIKARRPAFALAAHGAVPVAFLWKNLLSMGSFFRLRTWLWFAAGIVVFHVGAAIFGLSRHFYVLFAVVPLAAGAWLLVVGPMFMRHDLRLLITHFDLFKGYPLRGWQVVLGSLLAPIAILVSVLWLLLLLGAPSLGFAHKAPQLAAGVLGVGALGTALVVPPLIGLMLSIPFAATLFFPAWADSSASMTSGGGGIEAMGQRLIFFFGYLLVLLMTLVPAGLCAAFTAVIVHWLLGPLGAVVATAVVASVVISAEFAAVVWWLGERFERFDLSREIPR